MAVREELMREIERATDEVLQVLLSILRLNQMNLSTSIDASQAANSASQKHYPLRDLPIIIAEDFEATMTDSEVVRAALQKLQLALEADKLQESALYAEIYAGDPELQELA
ncbi:hypothetical protein [Microseira sp. BLCC-F43]|jgi:hypothetical protein|uniref:hypothetical protein n=1 Tax=Microseira sp. BLCC-F43 TaxID=3153602 RepID=UPI0035B74686